MEQVIDRLVEELDILKDLDFDEGGFRDEVDLADDVWWGDPNTAADQQYPLMYVQPVNEVPAGGTNSQVFKDLTIEVACLVDPRTEWDETEVTEATASRELVRIGSAVNRRLETININLPGSFVERVRSITVTETSYPSQTRGALLLSSVVLTVVVQRAYDRAKS